jgi:hypothetical protein
MRYIVLSLLVITFSVSTFAKTVARVLAVEGNAFSFASGGYSKQLSYGGKIKDLTVIMVEDGSQVSIKDEYGRIFHMAGGTQAKFFEQSIEVEKGYIWVSSTISDSIGTINSANSITKFTQGQFIYSFDSVQDKAQVLVLSGNVKFSNIVEPEIIVDVPAGHFSFVKHEYEKGLPRRATRVGLTSYKGIKKIFNNNDLIKHQSFDKAFGSDEMKVNSGTKRAIASIPVSEGVRRSQSRGKVVFVETTEKGRIPASASGPMDYYKRYKAKNKSSRKSKKVAPVRMFGFDEFNSVEPKVISLSIVPVKTKSKVTVKPIIEEIKSLPKASLRMPASVDSSSMVNDLKNDSLFEKSLERSIDTNQRHPTETNQLIDELKSFDQTYQKQY